MCRSFATDMPLSVIFGIGYWMNVENTSVWKFHTFFTFGMLRIYILSCIGIFSYLLCKKLKEILFPMRDGGR